MMMPCYINDIRAADYLPWCGIYFTSCCRVDWQGGWKTHAEQQKGNEKGEQPFWSRKGTTLTLIIHCHWFHWLSPFSHWKCVIQGNQLLLCSVGEECKWDQDSSFQLTLIFVPSSSGSGSDIISICEQKKKKTSERKKALEKWYFRQGDVTHENYITTTPKSILNLLMQINVSRWPWAFEKLEIVCRCCDKCSGKMAVALTAATLSDHKTKTVK